jgi:hypothetical protein
METRSSKIEDDRSYELRVGPMMALSFKEKEERT